uniref:Uncharacterized protein n=1 Tax=Ditylenchus dipsaci TaxID=166011 RepID=A0A915EE93_9BILA
MKRLPSIRRKSDYISQIDAARKRQRFEKELCNIEDVEYVEETPEIGLCETTNSPVSEVNDIAYTDIPPNGRLNSHRYRVVKKSDLVHDTSYYTQHYPSSTLGTSSTNRIKLDGPWSSTQYVHTQSYDTSDDYTEEYEMQPQTSSNICVDGLPPSRQRKVMPRWYVPKDSNNLHAEEDEEDHRLNDLVAREQKHFVPKPKSLMEILPTDNAQYGYVDELREQIQEQIEVVDEEGEFPLTENIHSGDLYYTPVSFAAGLIDVHKLFDLMVRHKSRSNEHLMESFLPDPAMSFPLDVTSLVEAARTASSEENAQSIASLAMQVNYLKRDMIKMRQDLTDIRSALYLRENSCYTIRKFIPTAEISQDWKILAKPPLLEVDLVQVARELNVSRSGKKTLKNKDAIGRFVKAALKKLVPKEVVKSYTVKDRKQNGAFDIGNHAKDQITGIVLDLMGLYNVEGLDNKARADRANYSQLVNEAMKHAMYDMRRTSPKRKIVNS